MSPIEHDDFRARFRSRTAIELVTIFNREVGNQGWVSARGRLLVALREALLATGLNCSAFITEGGMSLARCLTIDADRILPAFDGPGTGGALVLIPRG